MDTVKIYITAILEYYRWTSLFSLMTREYMPTLEEFFEEAIEQADPENMVESEYK